MAATGDPLVGFVEVMRRLRAECPWKQEQTHRSLVRYLVEETYEVVDAIDSVDAAGPLDVAAGPAADEHLCEELGDLLLQVYFHAAIAEEQGRFDIDDVAAAITDKMVRRNPHVLGAAQDRSLAAPPTAAQVNESWQAIKATETARTSVLDGLPSELPALLLADKVVDRSARAGAPVVPAPGGDLGDRLLALVVEANAAGLDPEQALRDAVRRVVAGFSPGLSPD